MMSETDLMHYLIRGCRSKQQYGTKDKADNAVDKALELRKELVYWYHCGFCQKYHLTSQPPDDKLNKSIRDSIIRLGNGEKYDV